MNNVDEMELSLDSIFFGIFFKKVGEILITF